MALISKVHIETAWKNGKTILKKSFHNPPFKIADVTEDRSQPALQLMLMSSSPGVLDKDEYSFQIDVAENSVLQLTTQSYQRLFQMKEGATQTVTAQLQQGSSFSYIPHPLVPHEGAMFSSKNKIHLSDNCSLIWGEVMSCGRKQNNEVFKFSSYHSMTEIFLKGKLVVKENLLIRPAEVHPLSMGQLEGYTHQASLIFINERADTTILKETILEYLQAESTISFGVSALPVKGLIIRLLGYKAEQLFTILKNIGCYCQASKQNQFKTQQVDVFSN
jgi:urease accessory protein